MNDTFEPYLAHLLNLNVHFNWNCLPQVILDPSDEDDFCPMTLLLLLAVAKDLEDVLKNRDILAARKFFHGLLERPVFKVQLHVDVFLS